MTLAAAVQLLTTALMLLQVVSANPSLPQSVRDTAQQVALNAIGEAQRAISGQSTAVAADTNAVSHRGQNGQTFTYQCPPNVGVATVWGTETYTDDSSICNAAIHAGAITREAGGSVSILIREAQGSYVGSTRRGVMTHSYGGWHGSFIVLFSSGGLYPATSTGMAGGASQERVRDERRVSDIKQLQLALELYYDMHGAYPRTYAGQWAQVQTALSMLVTEGIITILPSDTIASYGYASRSGGTAYVLSAILEDTTNPVLQGDIDGTIVTDSGEFFCSDTGPPRPSYCVDGGVQPVPTSNASAGALPRNAVQRRGLNGQSFTYQCTPNSTPATVWGVDTYTDDSSICDAAIHAGVIQHATGGAVTFTIQPGQSSYLGSTRNGVTTRTYGAWPGSFTVR